MFKSGLMLLSSVPQLNRLSGYLRAANKTITNTLYISIEPNLLSPNSGKDKKNVVNELIHILPQIYAEANRSAPYLDVRVLHHQSYHKPYDNGKTNLRRCLQFMPQVVLINGTNFKEELIRNYLINEFNLNVQKIQGIPEHEDSHAETASDVNDHKEHKVYDNVCLGGTFDSLHNGHKVLLSWAQLRCNKCVTIGVTDESMVRNKTLWQLIKPIDIRIQELTKFVKDVDPFIEYNIVPISDPFGPAIVDKTLECIVVSHETLRGGQKINEIRIKKDLKPLDIVEIDLINESNKNSAYEEQKISSSSLRMRKLGTVLKEPEDKPHLPKRPYIIGLTGGIASGKSSVAEKLKSLGAGVINCDIMAHQTYQTTESPAYRDIVEYFGPSILNNELLIDRKKLGQIVFEDKQKLNVLNGIIWPKLEGMVMKRIQEMKEEVIVLEIALLLEAKWDHKVHQIWVSIIDEPEAIKRLKDRNNLSEEEARMRIRSQMLNEERVRKANVVFCTLWEHEFTMAQVKTAWDHLNNYLQTH